MYKIIYKLICILILLGFCACATNKHHGYNFSGVAADKLKVGMDKEQVVQLLGNPTSRATVGDQWFYISVNQNSGPLMNKDNMQEIIALNFKQNVISDIKKYHLQDKKDISFARDYTKTLGDDNNVFKEMIGNIGRFSDDDKKTGAISMPAPPPGL